MRPGEERGTDAFLKSLECLPITCGIARRAGSLKAAYARSGKTLSFADTIIAATALEHGLTLMTDNGKHFSLPELQLYPLP